MSDCSAAYTTITVWPGMMEVFRRDDSLAGGVRALNASARALDVSASALNASAKSGGS